MRLKVVETPYHNCRTACGDIAEGCKRCVLGEKLVLFVTGVCGQGCPYCPVSDQKNLKDVIFANEAKVESMEGALEEASIMRATGAGITGGDPLAVIARTCEFIRLAKGRFGPDFHIHLYTPLLRVNEQSLQRLADAGLDEIRFHPNILGDDSQWGRLLLARKFSWSIGVEVPAVPDHEEDIARLLRFLAEHDAVDFVNLNEFEYADNFVFEKSGLSFEPKDALSYAVKGSRDSALRLLELAEDLGVPAHFCTAKSKDSVQLAQRLIRRAQRAARPFDAVDDEGLLTRGAVYDTVDITMERTQERLDGLSDADREASLARLEDLRAHVIEVYDVPEELIGLDAPRLRLLTSTSLAEELAKGLNRTVALVKEYPTADCFLVEAEVLSKGGA